MNAVFLPDWGGGPGARRPRAPRTGAPWPVSRSAPGPVIRRSTDVEHARLHALDEFTPFLLGEGEDRPIRVLGVPHRDQDGHADLDAGSVLASAAELGDLVRGDVAHLSVLSLSGRRYFPPP